MPSERVQEAVLCTACQMEVFSALLAFCVGNSPVNGEFPSQRTSNADFDVSLMCDVNPYKLLNKQSNDWWIET